jgi:hypothetical protein
MKDRQWLGGLLGDQHPFLRAGDILPWQTCAWSSFSSASFSPAHLCGIFQHQIRNTLEG